MFKTKRGRIVAGGILIAVLVALSAVVYFNSDNLTVTGAEIVAEEIGGEVGIDTAAPETSSNDSLITIAIIAFSVVIVFLIFMIWLEFTPHSKLRKKLNRLMRTVNDESTETLKEAYQEVYNLYLKVSEKNKSNFYSKIVQLREKIEEQLKAEKKVEELVQSSAQAGFAEMKTIYDELYTHYLKLPAKTQHKYSIHLAHLKDQLERGSKGV
jgi:c-di-AMP phosphodiesterase-like protein